MYFSLINVNNTRHNKEKVTRLRKTISNIINVQFLYMQMHLPLIKIVVISSILHQRCSMLDIKDISGIIINNKNFHVFAYFIDVSDVEGG